MGEFWVPAVLPEKTQYLRWAPEWAPLGLLWALVGSGVVSLRIYSILGGLRLGSSWAPVGLRVLLLENLQHFRWAPEWAPLGLLWALVGSGVLFLRIYST